MTRKLAAAGVVVALAWAGVDVVRACGDKFLIIGSGPAAPRLYASIHPSAILVVKKRAGLAIDSPLLVTSLKRAGHSVRVIESPGALAQTLANARFDVILTDLGDAKAITAQASSASGQPAVVPVLSNPTAAQVASASQDFVCLLKAPDTAVNFLKVLDDLLGQRITANTGGKAPRKN